MNPVKRRLENALSVPLGLEFFLGRIVMLGSAAVFVVREAPYAFRLSRPSLAALAISAVGFLAVWCWFWLRVAGRREGWQPAFALVAITTAMTVAVWVNPIGIFPFYFVVVLAGAGYRWQLGLPVAVVTTGYAMGVWWYSGLANRWTLQGVVIMAGLAAASVLVRRFIGVQLELHRARNEVRRLAAAEARSALARDLHDQLGQDLTVAVLHAEMLSDDLRSAGDIEAAKRASVIAKTTRNALHGMRQTVTGLRAPNLSNELASARRALDLSGITLSVSVDATGLTRTVDETLAWAIREATTNTMRHSGADNCSITLHDDGSAVVLSVSDDGIGALSPAVGSGLTGLRERVAAVSGTLEIKDGGPGFTARIRVPRAKSLVDA